VIALVVGAVSWTAAVAPVAEAVADADCAVASLQAKAPKGTTIASAKIVPATDTLPQFCQVEGSVETPGNQAGFRLALPADWNGKYYFQGIGGFGGAFTNMNLGVSRKYASATTDMGHQAASFDGSWAATSMPKVIDFGHRGTHATAVATQALTTAYYTRKPEHAYFNGCSTGGRSALMEAQRYPDDFDGIIGGAPGFGVNLQLVRQDLYKWMTAKPENYVPASKIDVMAKATLAECDGKDGLKDGLISDPRLCSFKPETMKCAGADAPDCLTAPQVETVKRILAGLKTKSGEVLVPGFPIGHEALPSGWQQSIVGSKPPVFGPDGKATWKDGAPNGYVFAEQHFKYFFFKDPNYDWTTFDVERDRAKVEPLAQVLNSTDPDLKPFNKRSGKFILYHGWNDSMISAAWTMSYYEKVVNTVGGASQADQFIRLFMVPGMHHCGGGPGPNTFDSLTALENWVERGVAPDQIVASHLTDKKVDRTRPLCAYPKTAKYKGTGSIDEAANFVCEVPPKRSSN
jgi:feruloyl esterase